MKKIIALLLCVVMICSCMGVTAFAEEVGAPGDIVNLKNSLTFENLALGDSFNAGSARATLTLTDGMLNDDIELKLKSKLENVDIYVTEVKSVGKDAKDKIYTAVVDKDNALDGALLTVQPDVACSFDVIDRELLNTVTGILNPYEYSFKLKLVQTVCGDNASTDDVEESYQVIAEDVELSVVVVVTCTHANKGRIEKITDEASLFDEGAKAIYCEGCGWYLGEENIPIWMLQDNGRGLIWLIIQLINLIASLFAPPEPAPV